jgi:hypothetical protein
MQNAIELSDEAEAALSDARRVVYQKVRKCAADLEVADSAVAAAIENVGTCFDALTEFEKFIASIPKPDFMSLWRESKATRASGL